VRPAAPRAAGSRDDSAIIRRLARDTTRLLQNGPLMPRLEALLAEHFDVRSLSREPDLAAFLAREGARFETRDAMADLVVANLRSFFADGTLVTPLRDPEETP
jgi:hypothetical protein